MKNQNMKIRWMKKYLILSKKSFNVKNFFV